MPKSFSSDYSYGIKKMQESTIFSPCELQNDEDSDLNEKFKEES